MHVDDNSSHMCFLGDYKDVMHSMSKEDIFIFALGLACGVLPDDIKIGDLQVAQMHLHVAIEPLWGDETKSNVRCNPLE